MNKKLLALFIAIISICTVVNAQESKKDYTGLNLTKYVFKDSLGHEESLSQFKGKYVYLDVWASWCRPCINEFPHFDSLKTELSDKNIVFVQVSCDTQKQRWYNGLFWYKRHGKQWLITDSSSFMKDLGVATIPRYILLDKKGKVIEGFMTRASDAMTRKKILSLKGI